VTEEDEPARQSQLMQNYNTEAHQQRQETPLSKQTGIGKIQTDLNITSVKEIVG